MTTVRLSQTGVVNFMMTDRRFADIGVVLTGPFTKAQIAKVKLATRVRWGLMKKALEWLKANNSFILKGNGANFCSRRAFPAVIIMTTLLAGYLTPVSLS